MALDYTDHEIRVELARLGYDDITEDQLRTFKKNLIKLIRSERSKNENPESFDDRKETRGDKSGQKYHNVGNHTKERILNDTDDKTSYFRSTSDRSSSPSITKMYGTQSHVKINPQESSFYSRSPHLSSVHSEPNLKSKVVKWKIPRDDTSGDFMVSTAVDRPGYLDRSGRYDDDDIGQVRKQSAEEEGDEVDDQKTEYSKSQSRQKDVIWKMPGIITRKEHPHTRNLIKSKPFDLYQMYRRVWSAHPPVGEARRSAVCWQVHKKMLKKDEIKVPHKTMACNSYVIPTNKPRYELRWAVRQCIENYEMPPCGQFHEV